MGGEIVNVDLGYILVSTKSPLGFLAKNPIRSLFSGDECDGKLGTYSAGLGTLRKTRCHHAYCGSSRGFESHSLRWTMSLAQSLPNKLSAFT